MWIARQTKKLYAHHGPIVFLNTKAQTTNHIIKSLIDYPIITIKLNPENKANAWLMLTEALKQSKLALGSYDLAGLGKLKTPLTLTITHPECALEFSHELLKLANHHRIIFITNTLVKGLILPEATLFIKAKDLHVSQAEAIDLSKGQGSQKEIITLLEKSYFDYELFLSKLTAFLINQNLPEASNATALKDIHLKLQNFANEDKWPEALELALKRSPDNVSSILEQAGTYYHQQGKHKELYTLLDTTAQEITETYLFWKLTAASRLNKTKEIREQVERYLSMHEAPNLRALNAGLLSNLSKAKQEAKRAYTAKVTALTAFEYGRLQEITASLETLHEALLVAEKSAEPYEIIRNASLYASRLSLTGAYQEAAHWASWALQQFKDNTLKDTQRYLQLLNTLVFNKLLLGEQTEIQTLLTEIEEQVPNVPKPIQQLLRSTLGDSYLVKENPQKALTYYQLNHQSSKRQKLGEATKDCVQALLEIGNKQEAYDLAKQTYALVKQENPEYVKPAQLALGMALSAIKPQEAISQLTILVHDPQLACYWKTQAGLYLSYALIQTSNQQAAKKLLQSPTLQSGLKQLAVIGYRILLAPQEAREYVLSLWQPLQQGLELHLLGHNELWYQQKSLNLTPRQTEILVLISIYPGLSTEQLLEKLSSGPAKRRSLISSLSDIRKKLPLSHEPYYLNCTIKADYLDFSKEIQTNLKKALSLYQGPLLPQSDASGISSLRFRLEEELRQAVLNSNESSSLLNLAQKLEDDLELWEACLASLSENDTRASMVKARVKQLKVDWNLS